MELDHQPLTDLWPDQRNPLIINTLLFDGFVGRIRPTNVTHCYSTTSYLIGIRRPKLLRPEISLAQSFYNIFNSKGLRLQYIKSLACVSICC